VLDARRRRRAAGARRAARCPGRWGPGLPARGRDASGGHGDGAASGDGRRRDRDRVHVRRVRPHHHRAGLTPVCRGVIRAASFAIRRPGRARQPRESVAGPGRCAARRSTVKAVPKKGPRTGPARGGRGKGTVIDPAGSSTSAHSFPTNASLAKPGHDRGRARDAGAIALAGSAHLRAVAPSRRRVSRRRDPRGVVVFVRGNNRAPARSRVETRVDARTLRARSRAAPARSRAPVSRSKRRSVLTVIDRHGMKCDEMIATKIRSLSHHTQQADSIASALLRARASGFRSSAVTNDAAPRRGGLHPSHVRS
jgi:hypothetical protein